MTFDLEKLTCDQLHQLNHQIVSILRARNLSERNKHLAKFEIGDHVMFESESGTVKGYVIRVNQKSVSIDAYSPIGKWRVGPMSLKKIEEASDQKKSNVFNIFQ